MSELKNRVDMVNEYHKCQQITDYQRAFEEMRDRNANKDKNGEGYLAKDNESKKDSCCRIL